MATNHDWQDDYDAELAEAWGVDLASETDRERFTVDDDSKARWCLRKRALYARRIEERKASIDEEIERLKAFRARLDEQDRREIAFFEAKLAPYYDWLRDTERLGRRTGYPLPEGVLRRRWRGAAWSVKDPEAFAVWLEREGLVRTKKEPDVAAINARIEPMMDELGALWVDKDTGKPVPSLIVGQPGYETFAVEAK